MPLVAVLPLFQGCLDSVSPGQGSLCQFWKHVPLKSSCVALLSEAQVFPGVHPSPSSQSERLWVDLAYFCSPDIAVVVPSNWEEGSWIAELLPRQVNPLTWGAAIALVLAESVPKCSGFLGSRCESACSGLACQRADSAIAS